MIATKGHDEDVKTRELGEPPISSAHLHGEKLKRKLLTGVRMKWRARRFLAVSPSSSVDAKSDSSSVEVTKACSPTMLDRNMRPSS